MVIGQQPLVGVYGASSLHILHSLFGYKSTNHLIKREQSKYTCFAERENGRMICKNSWNKEQNKVEMCPPAYKSKKSAKNYQISEKVLIFAARMRVLA